jgi:tripeptidyl-peptidase-1
MSILRLLCALLLFAVVCDAAAVKKNECATQHVTFHLRLTDFSDAAVAAREAVFERRTVPSSPLFRVHLSIEEVAELFGTSNAVVDRLTRAVKANFGEDLPLRVSSTRDTVTISHVPVASPVAVQLLTANPPLHAGRATAVDVPVAWRRLGVTMLLAVPHTSRRCVAHGGRSRRSRGASDNDDSSSGSGFPGVNQSPITIRARYGIPNATITAGTNASQACAEFEGEQFYQANIEAFWSNYSIPGAAVTTVQVNGPNNGGYFGEGNLDLEYITALAPGAPTWWVEKNEFDMTAWVEDFLTLKPLPSVASISWGSGESGYDVSTMQSDSEHFKKLALLGVSVLAASGDVGTGSTGLFTCGTFDTNWPASSPHVTAVGATYSNASFGGPEGGWSGSGGGFSAYFARPAWQADLVDAYLASNVTLPATQFWNSTGRALPDVAALGTNFEVYSGGWGVETGTSAATPTFASIITRINADRLAEGKPTLGFLNAKLYALGKVGYDVTAGDNVNPACPAGFLATEGWDPVTGLGTPRYDYLRANL